MIEKIAALSHEQWSGWMKYLFSKSVSNPNGSITIPKWAVDRWKRQMNTPYEALPETEKQSDRDEAKKVIDLITIASSQPFGLDPEKADCEHHGPQGG